MAHGNVFKGTLLVAGTAIGGGMLGLPVMTAQGGFVPSLFIFVLCWLFMMSTGLLFLEIALWQKKETNIISMAEKTLGISGKVVAWIVYLFNFYCLALAYIVGCGSIFSDATGGMITNWQGSVVFVAIFGPLVYVGAKLVGKINVALMFGLILFFLAFVILGFDYVKVENLVHRNWWLSLAAMPIAFTSFAYQGIVPSLVHYLDFDAKKIRLSIILGSSIPLVAYIIWNWLILGIIPTFGPDGLIEAMMNGDTAVSPLKNALQNPVVPIIGHYFAFFAMVTSFLGVTLGLVDFLADGLKIEKNKHPATKALLCLAVFLPPLFVAYFHPDIFLEALGYAGGIGCAFLLGLLPITMVAVGRYRLGFKSSYHFPGGKMVLLGLLAFVLFELAFEIHHLLG